MKRFVFSISSGDPKDPSAHRNGWRVIQTDDDQEFHEAIITHAWSPIIWTGGERLEANFRGVLLAAIDIDDHYTIARARKVCEQRGLEYLIAPSRSHQKRKGPVGKGQSPRDRFRLIFRFHEPVDSLEVYRFNMGKLIHGWQADRACRDAARFFFPSIKISHFDHGAEPLVVLPPEPADPKKVAERQMIKSLNVERFRRKGEFPFWVMDFLKDGKLVGNGRNASCFAVAMELFSFGISEIEIYNLIRSAPFSREDFTERELESAIKSAKRRAGK